MAGVRAWTPLLLTVGGFAGLGSLALYRFLHTPSFAVRLVTGGGFAIYCVWMFWESRVSVREIAKPQSDADRGTMELCAAVKIALLVAALTGGLNLPAPFAISAVMFGIALLAAGIWLRVRAICTLGAAYSHRIRTPERLITSGIYRWLRHPAYAGTLLIHAGVVLLCLNWFSLAALVAWFAAVWYRIWVEEEWLDKTLMDYASYRRAVPGAWFPSLQGSLPILLSVLFVVSITALATLKLAAMHAPLAFALGLVLAIYLAWLAIESKLAVGEIAKDRTKIDRGTLELYALGRAATVLSALAGPTVWDRLGPWYPAGVGIFLAGVTLRLTAIRALGRFYSHRVRISATHQVVSEGPYGLLRHPAYSGMILAHVGFAVCFFNWISLTILLMILIPAVILRIRVEERALSALTGYPDYARSRARLVPGLW